MREVRNSEVRNGTALRTAVGGIVGGVVNRVVSRSLRRRDRSQLLSAVTACVQEWQWPVVPGATAQGAAGHGVPALCDCPRPDCPTPGAHPYDPPLLAATTDVRMVRWWWQRRPDAPVVVATGGAVSAVSLPLAAGERALGYFDTLRVPVGPVIATPSRCVLLVAPYGMQELAELLIAQEWVPTSLRFHGSGGYVLLPPSRTGAGAVRWLRAPGPAPAVAPGTEASGALSGSAGEGGGPWLPTVAALLEALVAASAATPDGARLAY
ncbi:bifunctional DNA primase/polymerase [Streptacidiphilus sp. PB12-B1b]|uniref:bifunctional DNA primase/polymerase n=1 Tax=Streptacidiphilus sp. PB12-B1b TaxID=2705012 RepID=UPI0015FA8926|nr:bifunctional DNA primase/polymerase [Streptacidiphilus sp. PB12-B1b]QMU74513.1 bifunctional DNA primase/polymerase [Streptacidiphilus sp. PB12-B1b]